MICARFPNCAKSTGIGAGNRSDLRSVGASKFQRCDGDAIAHEISGKPVIVIIGVGVGGGGDGGGVQVLQGGLFKMGVGGVVVVAAISPPPPHALTNTAPISAADIQEGCNFFKINPRKSRMRQRFIAKLEGCAFGKFRTLEQHPPCRVQDFADRRAAIIPHRVGAGG